MWELLKEAIAAKAIELDPDGPPPKVVVKQAADEAKAERMTSFKACFIVTLIPTLDRREGLQEWLFGDEAPEHLAVGAKLLFGQDWDALKERRRRVHLDQQHSPLGGDHKVEAVELKRAAARGCGAKER